MRVVNRRKQQFEGNSAGTDATDAVNLSQLNPANARRQMLDGDGAPSRGNDGA